MKINFENKVLHHESESIDFDKYINHKIADELAHYIMDNNFLVVKSEIVEKGTYNESKRYSSAIHVLTEDNHLKIMGLINVLKTTLDYRTDRAGIMALQELEQRINN